MNDGEGVKVLRTFCDGRECVISKFTVAPSTPRLCGGVVNAFLNTEDVQAILIVDGNDFFEFITDA